MSDSVYFMRQDGVYCIGPERIPQKVSYSVADDPRKWGTPDKMLGSTFNHHRAYDHWHRRKAWIDQYICNPWAGPIKEKSMKPGPFKSSTHGNIPLSLKGRELLAAERAAVIGALKERDLSWQGDISRARGELAKYMGELEANQKTRATETYKWADFHSELAEDMTQKRTLFPVTGLKLDSAILGDQLNSQVLSALRAKSDAVDAMQYFSKTFFQTPKDTNVKTDTKTQEPTPKTRSQLIGEATHELVQAQRELEWILQDAGKTPEQLYVGGNVVGSFLRGAVAQLVKEQWATLAKKATARAKARVAKAEKAVAALLGS